MDSGSAGSRRLEGVRSRILEMALGGDYIWGIIYWKKLRDGGIRRGEIAIEKGHVVISVVGY